MTELRLEKCKGCLKVRKWRIWVHLSEETKKMISQYYDLSFVLVICPDCRLKILQGKPIGGV